MNHFGSAQREILKGAALPSLAFTLLTRAGVCRRLVAAPHGGIVKAKSKIRSGLGPDNVQK